MQLSAASAAFRIHRGREGERPARPFPFLFFPLQLQTTEALQRAAYASVIFLFLSGLVSIIFTPSAGFHKQLPALVLSPAHVANIRSESQMVERLFFWYGFFS